MNLCNLTEIKIVGRPYTWNNKKDGADRVFSRIDRVLSNVEWGDLFYTTEAAFLEEAAFDHCPMILRWLQDWYYEETFQVFQHVGQCQKIHGTS